MRTKTLLLTVALTVAAAATSMAQAVYSVNVVGYVNVTVPAGKFQLVANQLNAANTTLGAIIPTAPDGFQAYHFTPSGVYDIATYDGLFGTGWDKPNLPLGPGGGLFVFNSDSVPFTFTCVGEVPTGTLTTAVPAGFSIRSSKVPQAGGLTSVLGYQPEDGDQCYQFNPVTGIYTIRTYDGLFTFSWDAEPSLAVGEAFFINSGSAKTWSRTFVVGP